MKFFKLITLFAVTVVTAVQGARVLNFTQYDYEWVKGKDYDIQYTYLEEPSFSNFQIRLYNSTDSISLKKVSTSDYSDKDVHSVTLSYPEVSTGKYKIVGLSEDGSEISNNFSVKLVLKASPTETASSTPTTTSSNTATQTDTNPKNNTTDDDSSNIWKTIAIIVSILVVLLILAILGFIFYNRYKKNKQYEEEANTSIWKVPISEKSIIANRGINAYSIPNASVTERDLSFTSDMDGFYSYSSQVRNPDYFSTSTGYRERKERTKSVYSYSTNVTKASNNILDILYPSNEKKEREKSLHEKSEVSIELGHSHSQKSMGKRRKHTNSTSNGQLRSPKSRNSERVKSYVEVRARSNSFKANAMANKKSRVTVAECENAILHKKSRTSLSESEKNTNILNQLSENEGDISLNNINTPLSSPTTQKNETVISPGTPEYYIKNTKLNKKYNAVCNFKPKLIDEMNVTKNDIIVVHEVFTDGWGLGRNITTDKEGLLPLNCLNIEA